MAPETFQAPRLPAAVRRRPRGVALALGSALAMGALGCGDDPFEARWVSAPDTVLLYSLARPELNLPSAFSFNRGLRLRVEAPGATGQWDLALDTRGSELVFLPPGALGINSRARIAALPGLVFEELREAPSDTSAYVADEPLPVTAGTIYVVRTGQTVDAFGRSCVRFAKLEPLVIDVEAGSLEFVYDANPVCNDPRLVPPD